MRKKAVQKHMFTVLLTALSMVSALSFTACGKKNKETVSGEVQQKNGYVYESAFQDLGKYHVNNILNTCLMEDQFYLCGQDYHYNEKTDKSSNTYYLMHCAIDGTEFSTQKIDLSELGKKESINTLIADDKGTLYLVSSEYKKNTEYTYLYQLSEDGTLSGKVSLKIKDDAESEDKNFYYYSNAIFFDDMLYVPSDQNVVSFHRDGSMGKLYPLADELNYLDTIFADSDGNLYVTGSNGDHYMIFPFDAKTGKLREGMDFGDYNVNTIRQVQKGKGSTIYFHDYTYLYEYDLSKGKAKQLFHWLNVDIQSGNLVAYAPVEGGGFSVINNEYINDDTLGLEKASIAKVKASDAKQKTVLTLAVGSWVDYDLSSRILKYNKTSESSRIELKDYTSYEQPGQKLNLDIIAGNVPDIMEVSNLPKEVYMKKGIITDLYPLMKDDPEVNQDNFMDSIVRLLEMDGKLYYMPSTFSIHALAGSKKDFGDATGWNMDEMIQAYDTMKKGRTFIKDMNMTRDYFVTQIISPQLDYFIDWTTGETHFDTEEFIKIIKFSNHFESMEEIEVEDAQYEEDRDQESIPKQIHDGKLVLKSFDLYDFRSLQFHDQMYEKQGGYTVLSYPNEEKDDQLSAYFESFYLAISEKCREKEKAWQFVRQFLTYDYEKETTDGFPTRKDVFDIKLEHAMATKKYTDKDGEKIKPFKGDYGYEDISIKEAPLTEENAQQIRELVGRIGHSNSDDTLTSGVLDIINEELQAFYADDKTAEDTAKVIQSRAKIYVSENL